MAEVSITKQTVQNYLDLENKELMQEMKEKIESADKWKEFKKELVSLIVSFANRPTAENKNRLNDLISANYISNHIFAQDALTKIYRGLGIRQETVKTGSTARSNSSSVTKEEHRRSIYEELGIEYAGDIREEGKKDIKRLLNEHYGISEKKKSKRINSLAISDPEDVSPEILVENREIIETASKKLEVFITELEKAKVDIRSKNDARNIDIPDDILSPYFDMIDGVMDEEYFVDFESALKQKQEKQIKTIRDSFEYLQKAKLEKTLKELALSKFEDMPPRELDAEIKYVMLDSKIDKDGKLVLPKRSIFKDLMFDEKGELLPDQANLATSITTYGSVKKVSELSDEEIGDAVTKFVEEHSEMLPEDSELKLELIENTSKEHLLTRDIAEEAEIRHKLLISEEIKEQFEKISRIVKSYDEKEHSDTGLSKAEERKRNALLRIAKKKVALLEKAGLSKIIADGEKTSDDIMEKAKGILLPKLEATRNRAKKRIDKALDLDETEERK